MADSFTPAQRSEIMARVRSRGNKTTEILLAALFRRNGITGWRRHLKISLVGTTASPSSVRPDFVFPKLRIAVFVDGCFWHGCPKHGARPSSNTAYWTGKIEKNRRRDRFVQKLLQKQGWEVVRIWEHALSSAQQVRTFNRITKKFPSLIKENQADRRRNELA
jgi:DNA mismatch endonuclease (patch repair protein)